MKKRKKVLTPKQRVLARRRTAHCVPDQFIPLKGIWYRRSNNYWYSFGWGDTARAAWSDAARRLAARKGEKQ